MTVKRLACFLLGILFFIKLNQEVIYHSVELVNLLIKSSISSVLIFLQELKILPRRSSTERIDF